MAPPSEERVNRLHSPLYFHLIIVDSIFISMALLPYDSLFSRHTYMCMPLVPCVTRTNCTRGCDLTGPFGSCQTSVKFVIAVGN
jgi:hypothetical protein